MFVWVAETIGISYRKDRSILKKKCRNIWNLQNENVPCSSAVLGAEPNFNHPTATIFSASNSVRFLVLPGTYDWAHRSLFCIGRINSTEGHKMAYSHPKRRFTDVLPALREQRHEN
jgi:hypothetical protein